MIFEKCVDYYYTNSDGLIYLINQQKDSYAKDLHNKIISILEDWLIPFAVHYDLETFDPTSFIAEPSQTSIVTNGIISTNQTINSFLTNEYTGDTFPVNQEILNTVTTNTDYTFPTYGSDLNEHLDHYCFDFLYDFLFTHFSTHFNCDIDEATFDSISESCYYFDYIRDNSFLAKSLYCSSALKLCGLSPNTMLYQIVGL